MSSIPPISLVSKQPLDGAESPNPAPEHIFHVASNSEAEVNKCLLLETLSCDEFSHLFDKFTLPALCALGRTNKVFRELVNDHLRRRAKLISDSVASIILAIQQKGIIDPEFFQIENQEALLAAEGGLKQDEALFSNLVRFFEGVSLADDTEDFVRSLFYHSSSDHIKKRFLERIVCLMTPNLAGPLSEFYITGFEEHPEFMEDFVCKFRSLLELEGVFTCRESLTHLLYLLDYWVTLREGLEGADPRALPLELVNGIKCSAFEMLQSSLSHQDVTSILASACKIMIGFHPHFICGRALNCLNNHFEDIQDLFIPQVFAILEDLLSQKSVSSSLRCNFYLNLFEIYNHPDIQGRVPQDLRAQYINLAKKEALLIEDPIEKVKFLLRIGSYAINLNDKAFHQPICSEICMQLEKVHSKDLCRILASFDRYINKHLALYSDQYPLACAKLALYLEARYLSSQQRPTNNFSLKGVNIDVLETLCFFEKEAIENLIVSAKHPQTLDFLSDLFLNQIDPERSLKLLLLVAEDAKFISEPLANAIFIPLIQCMPKDRQLYYLFEYLKMNVSFSARFHCDEFILDLESKVEDPKMYSNLLELYLEKHSNFEVFFKKREEQKLGQAENMNELFELLDLEN